MAYIIIKVIEILEHTHNIQAFVSFSFRFVSFRFVSLLEGKGKKRKKKKKERMSYQFTDMIKRKKKPFPSKLNRSFGFG